MRFGRLTIPVPILIAIFAMPVAADSQTVLTSRVTVVRVDAAVTNQGRPVDGLTAADFDVFDNGVPQKVWMLNAEDTPLSVYLVLDISTSVAGAKLKHLVEAATAFLDGLRDGDEAALVTFSEDLRLVTPLTSEITDVRTALTTVVPEGATSLIDALSAALLLPVIPERRTIAIVFGDGRDTLSWLSEKDVMGLAHRSEILGYAVALHEEARSLGRRSALGAVSEPTNLRILRRTAETTGGQMALADSSAHLKGLFLQALRDIRGRYVLAYYPEGVTSDGWHTIEVKLRGKKGDVRTRQGYFTSHPR